MVYKTLFSALVIVIAASGFIFTFVTAGHLISFLSYFPSPDDVTVESGTTAAWRLMVNFALLCLFVFQHSAMAKPIFKQALYSSRFKVTERSIYIITTTLVLQCVIRYWQPIPWISLWHCDTSGTVLWTVFSVMHIFAWGIIYIVSLMMDVPELLGVKQVYYHLRGLPDPITFKSRELQRFYLHMRHPSFIGFCILFWIYPFMSLDRALLAGMWTLYMMMTWNVDYFDYQYQSQQLKIKQYELNESKQRSYY